MPTRLSLGATSFPVRASPAALNPTLIHGPMPIVKTAGSPSSSHSMATSRSSALGPRSLLWATQRWPSAVARGQATMSEQRPSLAGSAASSSSIDAAKTAAAPTPAPSATPSSSSISHGSSRAVTAR